MEPSAEQPAAATVDRDACDFRPSRHKKPRPRRPLGVRIARGVGFGLLGVVALAGIAAAVAVALWNHSVKLGEQKVAAAAMLQDYAERQTDETGGASGEQAEAPKPYTPTIDGTITYKGQKYAPNERMVSIAFIGYDNAETGGTVGQADMVVVMALNLESGKVTAISIPRDTMVEVGKYVGDAYRGQETMQLCLAYSYGDGGTTSAQHVAELASRILYDVPVSYHFSLNLQGIVPINDYIGGVQVTALQDIPNTGIVAGQDVVLLGDDALSYLRWRDSDNPDAALTSSLDRQSRQIQYLQEFASRIIEAAKADPTVLAHLYNLVVQYTYTNLGLAEFTYLATQVIDTGLTDLTMVSLPGEMSLGANHAEFYLDKDGVRQIVMDTYYHVVEDDASPDAGSSASGGATDEEVTQSNTSIADMPQDSADVQDESSTGAGVDDDLLAAAAAAVAQSQGE